MAKKKRAKTSKKSIKNTRWASWEGGVLSKVEDPAACQALIKKRQRIIDADKSEADLVADHFRWELKRRGHTPETCRVFIPSRVAAEWLGAATKERRATNKASEHLNGLGIAELKKTKHNGNPGWRWEGPNANRNKDTRAITLELNRLPARERNRRD